MPKLTVGLDRGEQEQKVETTPEMIEAGASVDRKYAAVEFECGETDESMRIREMFLAMIAAKPKGTVY